MQLGEQKFPQNPVSRRAAGEDSPSCRCWFPVHYMRAQVSFVLVTSLSCGMMLIQPHPSDLCPSLCSLPAGILQISPWGPAVCQVSPAQPLGEPGSSRVPL